MNPKIKKLFSLKWYVLVSFYVINLFLIYTQATKRSECGFINECTVISRILDNFGFFLFPVLVAYTFFYIVYHVYSYVQDRKNGKLVKKPKKINKKKRINFGIWSFLCGLGSLIFSFFLWVAQTSWFLGWKKSYLGALVILVIGLFGLGLSASGIILYFKPKNIRRYGLIISIIGTFLILAIIGIWLYRSTLPLNLAQQFRFYTIISWFT